MSSFKVAAYQMPVTPDPEVNAARIVEGISEASAAGAKMIALPECALSGYPPLHYPDRASINVDLIQRLNDRVCRAARDAGLWVVLGTIVREGRDLLNTALVISDTGEVVGQYDKLHLMPLDRSFFRPGQGARAFRAGDFVFGVQICYDARFPEAFRYLREQGARLMIIISNACGGETWKQPVLEGTYRARASENSCFLVAVNAAGPLQMASSRICNPLGLDLASANVDREEMLYAEIDLWETESGYWHDRRADQFEVVAKRVSATRPSAPGSTSR